MHLLAASSNGVVWAIAPCTQAGPCEIFLPNTSPKPFVAIPFSMPLDMLVVLPASQIGGQLHSGHQMLLLAAIEMSCKHGDEKLSIQVI